MGFVAHASDELQACSQYRTIIAICICMPACSTLIVCGRLWIRKSKASLRLDDLMAFLAMMLCIVYSSLCIVQAKYGLGLPPTLRPKQSFDAYTKVNFAGRPIYQIGISLFKISLLLSYLKLLHDTNMRLYRNVVWVAIAIVSIGHLGSALSLIFACDPVQKSWKPRLPGTCLPDGPSFTAYATLTIVSDIVVTIIPLPLLLQVKVACGRKIGLVVVFALGLFTTICSILRYMQIHRVQSGDHDSTLLVLWGVVEFNVGNIVSSLPFLVPVMLRKAEDYRTRRWYGYEREQITSYNGNTTGSANSNAIKFAKSYLLRYMSNTTLDFGTTTLITGSAESTKHCTRAIVKSVGYGVQVDAERDV